ncbi:MAG: anthranilate phosphoribosyltransferase, partial [Verrucomicrobiota bacterium]
GNRGITSKSGGADVLEALGVRIDLSPDEFRRCVESAGLGFMFAPNYHPAFKAVVGVRKILAARGVRTIFNLIGPLLNPAKPQCQLVGVFSRDLCPVFAEILERLGRDSAWVVNGSTADGRAVDEFSLMGSTRARTRSGIRAILAWMWWMLVRFGVNRRRRMQQCSEKYWPARTAGQEPRWWCSTLRRASPVLGLPTP